jgi:hypothetical protein
MGCFSSIFGIIIGFFPPAQLNVGNIYFYEAFLILSLLIMVLIPFILIKFKKPHWTPDLNGLRKHHHTLVHSDQKH